MLANYYSPTPIATPLGNTNGVVHVISGGGIQIATEIFDYGDSIFLDVYDDAKEALVVRRLASEGWLADAMYDPPGWRELYAAYRGGGVGRVLSTILDPYYNAFSYRTMFMLGQLIQYVFLGVLWVIYWVLTAQFLWGFVVIAVLSLVGPIFIPFLLVPQLDWLGWGWFKGLVNGAVHMMISAGTFVVAAILLSMPLARLAEMPVPVAWTGGFAGLIDFGAILSLGYMPVIMLAGSASMQVGAMTQAIVSGSAPPLSGLFRRASEAVGSVATGLSPFQPLAGRAELPARGGAPVSQVTDTRLVAAAAAAARVSAGLPVPGGGRFPTPASAPPVVELPAGQAGQRVAREFGQLQRRFEQFRAGQITSEEFTTSLRGSQVRAQTAVSSDVARTHQAWRRLGESMGPSSGRPRRSGGADHVPQPS